MAEYIDRKKIHFHAFFDAGDYSQAMRCINNMTPANVIERSKIDKAIEEMESYEEEVYHRDTEKKEYACVYHCLEILKRNIGE